MSLCLVRAAQIHGRPFSVKERDTPFKAMENRGIQLSDVEQAEVLLKLEVLDEARRFGGKLLVLDETAPGDAGGLCAKGELFSYFEVNLHGGTVWTPREMYEQIGLRTGRMIHYHRVPITDEQAPHEDDCAPLPAPQLSMPLPDQHPSRKSTVHVLACSLSPAACHLRAICVQSTVSSTTCTPRTLAIRRASTSSTVR